MKEALLVGMAKNEEPWILEWIAYHRILGFDNILIITNNNTDGSDELFKKIKKLKNVKIVWHNPSAEYTIQRQAYNIAMNDELFFQHEWVCVLDIDEFLVLHEKNHIHHFLEEYNDCSTICVNWLLFSSNRKKEKNDGLVIERFTEVNYDWRSKNYSNCGNNRVAFKSISKIEKILSFSSHKCIFKDNKDKYFTTKKNSLVFEKKGTIDSSFKEYRGAQINHCIIKSFDEFIIKKNRSRSHNKLNN